MFIKLDITNIYQEKYIIISISLRRYSLRKVQDFMNQIDNLMLPENNIPLNLEENYLIGLLQDNLLRLKFFFVHLLSVRYPQVFDGQGIKKNVQYKLLSVLLKLVQYYPNYFTPQKLFIHTITCIKIILNKDDLWTGMNINHQIIINNFDQLWLNQNLQHLSDSQIATMTTIVDLLVANGVGMGTTPYDLLNQIKNTFGLSQSTVSALNALLDYAIIMKQTFFTKPQNALTACIIIHQNHINTNQLWVAQVLLNVSEDAILLKEKIETSLAGEMMH